MNRPFEGIYIALATPFTDGQPDPAKLRDNIRKYNAVDLAGYLVLGTTGESVSVSDTEAEALVAAAVETAAPGRKIIVGAGREATALALEFTNRMATLGAAGALVRPPMFFKSLLGQAALVHHFWTLADGSRMPILLYNFPQLTGIGLESELVLELSGHPNVAGLKDSSGHLALLQEVVPYVDSRFSFLIGAGSAVLPGLLLGASGGILAVANVMPDQCAALYRLFRQGKLDEALGLQRGLVAVNRAVTETYGIPGLKHALDLLGYHGGPPRAPLPPLGPGGRQRIETLLREVGLLR